MLRIIIDEGYTGWIEDMEMRDGFGVGSNTVNIEQLYQSESFYTSGSSGYLVYFIEAHERWNNYTGYLTFRVTCDEWGELSWGVSYGVTSCWEIVYDNCGKPYTLKLVDKDIFAD